MIASVYAGVIEQVLRVAIALLVETGNPNAQRIANWQVNHALDLVSIEVSIFAVCGGLEPRQIRLGRYEVDHARRRIATKQCPLRTAKDFDSLKVKIFCFKQARRTYG